MGLIKYDKLFLLLRTRNIKGAELIRNNIVSAPTILKLKVNKNVNTNVLIRLCDYLGCNLGDICEYVPDKLPLNEEYNTDIPFI